MTEKHATPAETKNINPSVDVKITFCTHVGWDGVLVILCLLIVAGLYGYLTYLYTSYFNNFHRGLIWVFMLKGLLCILIALYYLICWKHIASTFEGKERKLQEQETPAAISNCFEWAKARYNSLQIFGKYFLWQLYICEISESIMQMLNIFTIYTCSLPVG